MHDLPLTSGVGKPVLQQETDLLNTLKNSWHAKPPGESEPKPTSFQAFKSLVSNHRQQAYLGPP